MITNRLGRTAVLALLGATMLTACNPAKPAASETPAGATLSTPVALGANNEALPRVTAPDTAATKNVNAALEALDASWKENVTGCTDGDKQISRDTAVTRNASDFLGVSAAYDVSCGGAYPSSGTDDYTYDLTTGALADWSRLLPKAGISNSEVIPDYPTNTFSSPSLQARLLTVAEEHAKGDAEWRAGCYEVLSMQDLTLQAAFSPDKPVLLISPGSLPHAVQACGDDLELSVADLKTLGADPRLIAAVEAR